jgi:alpha-glucuronidase
MKREIARREFLRLSAVVAVGTVVAACAPPKPTATQSDRLAEQSRSKVMDAEAGYELWLRYRKIDNAERLAQYRQAINSAAVLGRGATAELIRSELARALPALLA